MKTYLKNIFQNSKKSLFTFNDEPFSRFSIFVIILLDIFLLSTIMMGISSEKQMSPSVYTKYPQECAKHFDKEYQSKIWNTISQRYLYTTEKAPFKEYDSFPPLPNNSYYGSVKLEKDIRLSNSCQDLYSKMGVFVNSKEFKNNRKLLAKLKNDKRNTLSAINNIETRYNTTLFEKAVNIHNEALKKTKVEYYKLLEDEKAIDLQIKLVKKVPSYKGYSEYVAFVEKNRDSFQVEKKKYTFWQPFISFMYLLKFTLPLLLLSYMAYRYSGRIGTPKTVPMKLTRLISGHIILISAVPIFFNSLYLIYHVIPRRFFERVIQFLYEFGVVFLGYYFLMGAGIVFFGLLVFFIQRNASRKQQIRREAAKKNLYVNAFNASKCPECNVRVDYSTQSYCGVCATPLNRECEECKKMTPFGLRHCVHCGK